MTDDNKRRFLAGYHEFKSGKATVMIGSSPKLVSQLEMMSDKKIASQMLEKSLETRAISSELFDDKLTNLIEVYG
jgi:hypothetical protein